MNAIRMFLPKAISPMFVLGPSAIISSTSTLSPLFTIGLWLKVVPWFAFLNLRIVYLSTFLSSSRVISIKSEDTLVTVPLCFALTTTPESLAALCSIPVPIIGA